MSQSAGTRSNLMKAADINLPDLQFITVDEVEMIEESALLRWLSLKRPSKDKTTFTRRARNEPDELHAKEQAEPALS